MADSRIDLKEQFEAALGRDTTRCVGCNGLVTLADGVTITAFDKSDGRDEALHVLLKNEGIGIADGPSKQVRNPSPVPNDEGAITIRLTPEYKTVFPTATFVCKKCIISGLRNLRHFELGASKLKTIMLAVLGGAVTTGVIELLTMWLV